jgi:rubredoxin
VTRPPFEVADVIRRAGSKFIDRYRSSLTWGQLKVLRAIERCRTAALGGHRDRCLDCLHRSAISFHSCRNRHCPKCQTNAREKWLRARQNELLPVNYFHVVFSVPHELVPLIWQNKRALFHLLFEACAATMLEIGSDPKRLGVEVGFLSILHTGGQTLQPHPHLHCVVPGGGPSADHTRWIGSGPRFFLPVKVLSRVFRRKFTDGLQQAFRNPSWLSLGSARRSITKRTSQRFSKPSPVSNGWFTPSRRSAVRNILQYLARYTHRVAISNHRLLGVNDHSVTFRWKDYAHQGKNRTMTLSHQEFLRRFLMHVLPKGLPRIRYFGWMANRRRGPSLLLCRSLLAQQSPSQTAAPATHSAVPAEWQCPHCLGSRRETERLTHAQILLERQVAIPDSS